MSPIPRAALLLVATATLFASTSALPSSLPRRKIDGTKYLISFGDSYSQTGFNISGQKASPSNPLGNPPFPGYTTDGGTNWLGHLVDTYNTSLFLSYNFAYGGATVDASLVTPYEPTVLSLIDQVNEFKTSIASKPSYAPWTGDNTLFAIWMGVNDIGNSYYAANSSEITSKVLDQYIAQVQELYDAGGRFFVFLSVPPINKTPLMLAEATSAQTQEATAIASFNTQLATRVAAFENAAADTTTWIYDTSLAFNAALSNPTLYGASAGGATCFNADGVSCLWWNNYHPGQAIQKLVAEGVAGVLNGTFY